VLLNSIFLLTNIITVLLSLFICVESQNLHSITVVVIHKELIVGVGCIVTVKSRKFEEDMGRYPINKKRLY